MEERMLERVTLVLNGKEEASEDEVLRRKRGRMLEELEKLRIVNRKLWFGLWLSGFIKRYCDKGQEENGESLRKQDKQDIKWGKCWILQYIILSILTSTVFGYLCLQRLIADQQVS